MYVKCAGPKKAWISIGRGADFGAHLYPGCKVRLLVEKFVFWLQSAPIAPDPLLFWGASSPPDPLAGGLQPPAPPRIFLRGSASQALRFLGYQDLGTRTLEPKWNQIRTKMEPKWNHNRTNMEPKWNQMEPKWNQHGTKIEPTSKGW